MSAPIPHSLDSLLAHQEIGGWLRSFAALGGDLYPAILHPDGRLFVGAEGWDEAAQAEAAAALAALQPDGRPAATAHLHLYPLDAGPGRIGVLAVRNAASTQGEALARLLHGSLALLLTQAVEKGSLAQEALGKEQLVQEAEKRAAQLQALNEIAKELSSTLDLERLLQLIMRRAVELLNAEAGSLFLTDAASGDLVFRVVHGGAEDLVGTHIPAGAGIVGEAATTGQPVIVNKVKGDQRWFQDLDKTTGFSTESLLAVPLCTQDCSLGVLELINRRDGSPFQDEDVELLTTFAAQAAVAIDMASLHQAALEKERLERELELAFEMQSSLIPLRTPRIPGWDFAAYWKPARKVGGDFYDFVRVGDELGMVIADVADKGMHAALFMALSRSIVRASVTAAPTPADGLTRANRLLCADAKGGMFVTLFYGQLDPSSGELAYVNCGHNPPLIYRTASREFEELGTTGIVLGFDPAWPFEQRRACLEPGDYLVLYTDGVTEATGEGSEQFGDEQLVPSLLAGHGKAAGEVLDGVRAALEVFIGEATQFDDITLVVIKRE